MDIEIIREKIAQQISQRGEWLDALSDCEPGHYGVEDWEVEISKDDIWVDIPGRAFTFKNASFSFDLLLGSSNKNDGIQEDFSRETSGHGTFEFTNGNTGISIEELEIKVDLDLYSEV